MLYHDANESLLAFVVVLPSILQDAFGMDLSFRRIETGENGGLLVFSA
jgi:hypothetical protein